MLFTAASQRSTAKLWNGDTPFHSIIVLSIELDANCIVGSPIMEINFVISLSCARMDLNSVMSLSLIRQNLMRQSSEHERRMLFGSSRNERIRPVCAFSFLMECSHVLFS